jgi:hypothetical protein
MFHEQLFFLKKNSNKNIFYTKINYILSVSNGGRPVNNVTISIPNDHTSVAKLCGFRLAISLIKCKRIN